MRKFCSKIIGVDLSQQMLSKALLKQVYHRLVISDICDFMHNSVDDDSVDLIVAADVFIYIGDLDEVFENVRKRSNKGALFLFSTEHVETQSYTLLSSGRYAHPEKYINSLLLTYKLKKVAFSIEKIRKEDGKWIKGGVYLLKVLS